MCTPSSWRWLMRKYDLWPLWRLCFLFFFFFEILEDRSHAAVLLILTDSVKEHQMKGGQRKRITDSGETLTAKMNRWKHQRECGLLSLTDSWGLSLDRGTRMPTWLQPNAKEKRESYFSEWTTCRFLRSLPRNLQRMAIFNHIDDSDS